MGSTSHIYPKHVHKALRRYLGIEKFAARKGFPFNNTERSSAEETSSDERFMTVSRSRTYLARAGPIVLAVALSASSVEAQDRSEADRSWEAERQRVEQMCRAYEFRRAIAHVRMRSEPDIAALRASTPPVAEAMCPVLSDPAARWQYQRQAHKWREQAFRRSTGLQPRTGLSVFSESKPSNPAFAKSVSPTMVSTAVLASVAASASASSVSESAHMVPLFPSASDALGRQGFARVINHSGEAGEVTIEAFDDEGMSYGPLTLSIGAGETVHFNSNDLEDGNAGKGLTGSTGPGQDDWRLELTSGLDIEVLSYIRTTDGFLTAMHDTVPVVDGRREAAIFNPGSNADQESLLRLVNPGEADATVTITAVDDKGLSPGEGATVTIPAGASRTYTAAELESGSASGLEGVIGDGTGKWRLEVESEEEIVAMSLLSSPTGHLTNLSTAPDNEQDGTHAAPLFPSASDARGRQGFARVANRSDEAGEVMIEAFDDTDREYEVLTLSIGAGETRHFNSDDLELGNADKGLTGSTGAGDGDWRLELSSELDIEVLSYIRTADGFLTAMHDVAPSAGNRHRVAVFNPGSNRDQLSQLRLVNPGDETAEVSIAGTDDRGVAGENTVRLSIPGGGSRTVEAWELESGAAGLTGLLGDGTGKWQLKVTSPVPLVAMSLLSSPTGHLTNLSTAPSRRAGEPAPRTAGGVFRQLISGPVVHSNCVTCHVEDGEAGNTRLVFVDAADPDHEASNLRVFQDFVADVEDARDYLLGKMRGVNHEGGSLVAAGTVEYADMERFLGLLGDGDRAALTALYDATGGPDWKNNDKWLTDDPVGEWHGVVVDEEGRVSRLSLPNNGLTGSIPPEVGTVTHLKILHLGSNRLTGPIPPEIGDLTRLEQLILLYTDLTGELPRELGSLSELRFLAIAQTAINPGAGVEGSIPPEIGRLSKLRTAWLHGNRFTGALPPALGQLRELRTMWIGGIKGVRGVGDLPGLTGSLPRELGELERLEKLWLEDNSLTGPIPPELGRLTRLVEIQLDGNRLSGRLPGELGSLTGLRALRLSGNQLTGPVPDGFGGMAGLTELNLSYNPGLSGPLPTGLSALGRLEKLYAVGTGLCAPADDDFLRWMGNVPFQRLPLCDLDDVAPVYLTQAVQSRAYPVPLVAGDPALLRVFVTAEGSTDANIPPVRATFFRDGAQSHVVDIPVGSVPIPSVIDEGDLASSANAEIPGETVQPGLELVVEVDPDGTLDPGLGIGKRIPATGRLALDVRRMPVFELTMIPFLWSEAPDQEIVEIADGLTTESDLLWMARDLLPVNDDFELRVHELVTTSTNVGVKLLGEAAAIKTMEGGTGWYWATMSGPTRGPPGLTGENRVVFGTPYPRIFAHELGHTMRLDHAACGGADGPDRAYPYAEGAIGTWGYDFSAGELVKPDVPDLMSYCHPPWISDFHFSNALRAWLHDESAAEQSFGTPVPALLLWGGVDANGRPFLEPAFAITAPASRPEPGGDYRIAGTTADGRELFALDFEMPEMVHGDGQSAFAFALPASPAWRAELVQLTLSGPGGTVVQKRDAERAIAVLLNPASGQVRGFLRDLPPDVTAADAALAVQSGLDVLISRGVPEPEAWAR